MPAPTRGAGSSSPGSTGDTVYSPLGTPSHGYLFLDPRKGARRTCECRVGRSPGSRLDVQGRLQPGKRQTLCCLKPVGCIDLCFPGIEPGDAAQAVAEASQSEQRVLAPTVVIGIGVPFGTARREVRIVVCPQITRLGVVRSEKSRSKKGKRAALSGVRSTPPATRRGEQQAADMRGSAKSSPWTAP